MRDPQTEPLHAAACEDGSWYRCEPCGHVFRADDGVGAVNRCRYCLQFARTHGDCVCEVLAAEDLAAYQLADTRI